MFENTAIISGANGQIGQFLIKHMQAESPTMRIVATTRHKSGSQLPKFIFDASKVIFESLELADPHSINALVAKYKPDYFVNCAASSLASASWNFPAETMAHNSSAVLNQLEAIRLFAPKCRYVNLGSSEEFPGDLGVIDEGMILEPRNPYGCSKLASRFLIRAYRRQYAMRVCQPWLFNTESELRGPEYLARKVTLGVARIAQCLWRGLPVVPIEFGNPETQRCWQFAGDVADAIWRMLTRGQCSTDYIVCADRSASIAEFIELAFKSADVSCVRSGWDTFESTQKSGLILAKSNPAFIRPGDAMYLRGDSNFIKSKLKWRTTTTLEGLIDRMVKHDTNLPL